METVTLTKKQLATKLLRRYDKLRLEMRTLEHQVAKAAADYGKELGYSGFSKDMLRIRLNNEKGGK